MAAKGNIPEFKTLKECLEFLQWLHHNKGAQGQLANRLYRLLNGKYRTVDQKLIEPALSQFLGNVSKFHTKLCTNPQRLYNGDKRTKPALNALLECIPELLAAVYFLRYQVDGSFKRLGGGGWANEQVGRVAMLAALRVMVVSHGSKIDEYLVAKNGVKKYGVIPGGFEPSELKQLGRDGYSQGSLMAGDLIKILDKANNNNNPFLDVYSTTVLSTAGFETANVANALRLVEDFCRIFESVKGEDDFEKHLYSKDRCIILEEIRAHCAELKGTLGKLFSRERFSFTGYAREYHKLNKENIAKKMASWFKKHLHTVKEKLKQIKTDAGVPKIPQSKLAAYFTEHFFSYGFTFYGYNFGRNNTPNKILKVNWVDVIKELNRSGAGLDKLVEILNGKECKLKEEKDREKKDGETGKKDRDEENIDRHEKPDSPDGDSENEYDEESEDEEDEPLQDLDDPPSNKIEATKTEAAKPVVTKAEVAKPTATKTEATKTEPMKPPAPKDDGSPNQGKKAEGAQNQGKKAEGAQNQGKKAEGNQNQGNDHSVGNTSSSPVTQAVQTQPSSSQYSKTASPGGPESSGGQAPGGEAGSSGTAPQDAQEAKTGKDAGTTTSTAPGLGVGGDGAGGDSGAKGNGDPPPNPPPYQCRDNDLENYTMGTSTYCVRKNSLKPTLKDQEQQDTVWETQKRHIVEQIYDKHNNDHPNRQILRNKMNTTHSRNPHTIPNQIKRPAPGYSSRPTGDHVSNGRPYFVPRERDTVQGGEGADRNAITDTQFGYIDGTVIQNNSDIELQKLKNRFGAFHNVFQTSRDLQEQQDNDEQKQLQEAIQQEEKEAVTKWEKQQEEAKKRADKYYDDVERVQKIFERNRQEAEARRKQEEADELKRKKELEERTSQEEENERKKQMDIAAQHQLMPAPNYYHNQRPHYYNTPEYMASVMSSFADNGGPMLEGLNVYPQDILDGMDPYDLSGEAVNNRDDRLATVMHYPATAEFDGTIVDDGKNKKYEEEAKQEWISRQKKAFYDDLQSKIEHTNAESLFVSGAPINHSSPGVPFIGNILEQQSDTDFNRKHEKHMIVDSKQFKVTGDKIPFLLPKFIPKASPLHAMATGYPLKPTKTSSASSFQIRQPLKQPMVTDRMKPTGIAARQNKHSVLAYAPPLPITESIDDLATAKFLNVSGTTLTKKSKADANVPVLQEIDPSVPQFMLGGSPVPDSALPSSQIPRDTFLTEPQPTMGFQIEFPKRTVRKVDPEIGLSIEVPPHEDRTFNDVDLDDPYANTADILKDEFKPSDDKGFSGLPNNNFDLDFGPERAGLTDYDDPGMPHDSPRKADERVINPFSTDECHNPWSVDTSTTDTTSPPATPPPNSDHLPPPKTVREMLYWFVGLNTYGLIGQIKHCVESILVESNNTSSKSPYAIDVTGDPNQLTSSLVTAKLTETCLYSATVIYRIRHHDNYTAYKDFKFDSVYSNLRYSPDPSALLCQLRDYVYACHHQLEFLKAQCKRDKPTGGWKHDEYGSETKKPSPLQAFLTDGWDCPYDTHPFDPCNLCHKSRVRMGFVKEDLPDKSQLGSVISTILTSSCGGSDPLLTLSSYLNCLTRRTPRTTGELVSFFHNFSIELHDYASEAFSKLGTALAKSHPDCPDWDHLKNSDLQAVKGIRGSETLTTIHNSKHDHPKTLSTLVGCGDDSSNCHPHCSPITYLSWAVYLPDRLHESLEKLYYDLQKHFGSGKCTSLHLCSTALPLLYTHGITPPEGQSQVSVKCSDVIEKIKDIVAGQPIASLMAAMDSFLYNIREPFIYTLVTLWSTAFFFIANTILYRLDVLYIRSHLIRTKASHLIDVKALLSDNKKMMSLYDANYFDDDPNELLNLK